MARGARRAETRIGHEARAAATGTLDTALREGRLDLAEYERRLVVIQAAKVQQDLTPTLADLPERDGQRGPGLRISTADREGALVRLTEALTDGRLEATEYAVAEDRLQRAATYAEIDAVVGDLALVADLSMGTESSDAPVRVSNADREAVAARLHDAVEGGFLDLSEFDERVRAVYAARLSSELERVVADLPEPAPPAEPPVEKKFRREWRYFAFHIIAFYSLFGFVGVGFAADAMLGGGLGALALSPLAVWLIGFVPIVRSQRRLVEVEPAPHDEIERRTEQLERLAERLNRVTAQAEHVTVQLDQLPNLVEQLPPELAERIARQFRQQQLSERFVGLSEQYKPLWEQAAQLPDEVEQVSPEVVQQLTEQVDRLTAQFEQLAGEVERLTEQAKQSP